VANQLYRFNLLTILLLPFSALYWLLYRIHSLLYRYGILKTEQLPVPVIVVGNLTVGGTGKTPLVAWLGEHLKQHGYSPGIILRGYKGRATSTPLRVTETTDPTDAGDEAVLLAQKTSLPVYACTDRLAAAWALLAETDCNVIISDDGLQHRRLGRDIEIVVIDGARRFGNGLYLPAGPMRESRSRLQSVDFVLVRGGQPRENEIGYEYAVSGFRNLVSGEFFEMVDFPRPVINAVAAIGNPKQFFDSLVQMGFDVLRWPFPDHYRFRPADFAFNNDLPVIMTEKDAVKCADFATGNYWALVVEAELPAEFADTVLKRIDQVSKNGQKTA